MSENIYTDQFIEYARAEGAATERARIRELVKGMYPEDSFHYVPDYRHGYIDMKTKLLYLLKDGDGE